MYEQLKLAMERQADFASNELNEILASFTRVTVSRQTQLVKLDKVASYLFFVNKGAIRRYLLRDVEEINIAFAFENEFITSLGSFIQQQASDEIVEAIEDGELLCLHHDEYERLNRTYASMNVFSRKLVGEALLSSERQRQSLLFDTPEHRFRKMLMTQPQLLHRTSQRHVSSYLDIPLLQFSQMVEGLKH